jgi:hypothetical protein
MADVFTQEKRSEIMRNSKGWTGRFTYLGMQTERHHYMQFHNKFSINYRIVFVEFLSF